MVSGVLFAVAPLHYENLPMQYTEEKIENFIGKFFIFSKFMLKTLIVGTR